MPLYEYRCTRGHEFTAFNKIAERNNQLCECGAETKQRISAPSVIPDLAAYTSYAADINGTHIDGRKQHREFLRSHGYEEVGSEKPSVVKQWEDKQKELPPEKRAVNKQGQPIVKD